MQKDRERDLGIPAFISPKPLHQGGYVCPHKGLFTARFRTQKCLGPVGDDADMVSNLSVQSSTQSRVRQQIHSASGKDVILHMNGSYLGELIFELPLVSYSIEPWHLLINSNPTQRWDGGYSHQTKRNLRRLGDWPNV
jgi:hypothetical protein